jgi:hypothetical protein
MDKMPRNKKTAMADTVAAMGLFRTRRRAHTAKRASVAAIHAAKERGRSRWPTKIPKA